MKQEGQAEADRRAAAITAGRYDLMVEEYDYPLTVFVNGAARTLPTPRDAWGFFHGFHAALLASGLSTLSARVVAMDMPGQTRRRMWTDWIASAPGRRPVTVASTICYARQRGASMRTEMLEFTRLDLSFRVAA